MSGVYSIAILSLKGGVGKTTLAINLAVAAHRRGQHVFLADIDPQHSSSDALKMRKDAGPAVVKTTGPKLFQLRQAIERGGVDLLVIDTAPTSEAELLTAINAADLSLVVSRPNFLDIVAAVRTADLVRRLGRVGQVVLNQAPSKRQGVETGVVVTAYEALRFAALPVCPVGLRYRTAFQQSIAHGLSAEEWGRDPAAAEEVARIWEVVEQQRQLVRRSA